MLRGGKVVLLYKELQDFMPNLDDNAVNFSAFVGLCMKYVSLINCQYVSVVNYPSGNRWEL